MHSALFAYIFVDYITVNVLFYYQFASIILLCPKCPKMCSAHYRQIGSLCTGPTSSLSFSTS